MRRVYNVILKTIGWFIVVSLSLVLLFKFVPVPITLSMIGQAIEYGELQYDWEPIEDISPELAIAVVAAEDQLFPEHFGFDVEAIKKAIKRNEKSDKLRGGSTISQQTAKNVFLWQERNWIRKGLETYFTVLIELIWGKKRILEVYMNVCEFGPHVFGAESASKAYFKKTAHALSRSEASKMAAVLPSPRKWKIVNSGPYVQKRSAHIQRQIRQLGGISYLKALN
ncbi:monofunctional biosynthetic peptidoglycan transglycosylase [Marinilongibacter aquaticus]|uniref:monofunctional biosynthetic peptidoglycan transglycosylase n=1 Tax=Marinilongibacter aquaticus TaxID=2975157 RepID=UPI0021BDB193|nr:monofunctional biosynthetic peptidoglycan transglycosylase [Marinilongibacter aquaticus]UBM60455.1 monofunctional biosynthetic peptidoglycan transglycosylase [Marinilongibacter aquaticus]